jgi:hypothetical protein
VLVDVFSAADISDIFLLGMHEKVTKCIIYQKFPYHVRITKPPDAIARGWCGLSNEPINTATINNHY